MKKLIRTIIRVPAGIGNWLALRMAKVEHGTYTFVGLVHMFNKHGRIVMGNNVRLNSGLFANPIGGDTRMVIRVSAGATLTIGNNVAISNSAIICRVAITIDDNAMIGGSCKIWDTDFHPLNPDLRLANRNANYVSKPIYIGKNAFVGACSIILKGVTIGENAIIGAGSVVTGNVPANQIWAGNPARFIKNVT